MERAPKRYLTTTEAGALVGVRPNTIEKACKSGKLVPDAMIGRVKGFTLKTLREWRKSVRVYTRKAGRGRRSRRARMS